MAENPNFIATDEDGNELADNDVEVNGIIPGSGGGSSVLSDDDSDGLYEQDKDGIDVPTVKQQQTRYTPTEVSGNYTTAGESVIYADPSGGALTVTLASADATDGNVVEIYDVGESAGTNAITIATEGSETFNPGGKSSIDISLNGGFVKLRCRAGNWFTDRNRQSNQAQANSVNAGSGTITSSDKDMPGYPATTSDPGLTFGTWRQASSSRPASVSIAGQVQTDGTSNGNVQIAVDESGGTTADYDLPLAFISSNAGSGAKVSQTVSIELPTGAQYKVVNKSDPNGNNTILDTREVVK